MKALKFNLSGKTAFFKKPDVNKIYFTYTNIHKVALLGLLGASLGYGGYNQQKKANSSKKEKGDDYPEFYEKLKNLKLSIVPKDINVNKKIQVFNNGVGYASKEEGGNLIVKEQWLENPSWDVYILLDESEICREIEERFTKRKFVFIPYLGKNDHIANIDNIEVFEKHNIENIDDKDCFNLDSLFISDDFEIGVESFDSFDDEDMNKLEFKYQENLPCDLELTTNQYIFKTFVFTNINISSNDNGLMYQINGKNLYFF